MKAIKKFSDDALKQGGITSVWLFSRLQVVITDPILAEIVLKNCLEKDDLLEILRIFTGGGSIFAPVKTWRSRRRKIVRVFNIKNLKQFIKIIGRQSNVMVDQLRSLTNSGSISIVKYLKKTSLCTVYDLPEKLPTVLDILMKPNNAGTLSDVELCEEILVMIFAGTETMSVALSLVCVMLSKHPDEQEKVYQELKDVFGDETKQSTMDELLRLKYLEAVIKETLRMYPPGPIIMRKADKDVMLPSGITLVKGCGIVVSTWGIHRNPAYWGSDVEKFRPDRFLNDPPTHPVSFLPFSYGPRNCVGQQYSLLSMKVTLSTLLRYYRILPEGSSSGTGNITKDDKPLRCKYNVILNHVDNYIVELVARI
ncbi:probable cytochrome P450 4p3 [Achroia grisella]|uniref:probable cytochrome P450 4p3 n=1 Tax=Achroia grisella TaxID=688607 RepID=UPI0027D31D68|nr:probable cytochrome P450 4p3 [Achroia grisella]